MFSNYDNGIMHMSSIGSNLMTPIVAVSISEPVNQMEEKGSLICRLASLTEVVCSCDMAEMQFLFAASLSQVGVARCTDLLGQQSNWISVFAFCMMTTNCQKIWGVTSGWCPSFGHSGGWGGLITRLDGVSLSLGHG